MGQFIEWTDEISVGIQEIDEQHKQMVDIINRLYDTIIHPTPDETAVKAIMNDLVQYTAIHFAVEESLFRIFEYGDYENHKKHHEELRQEVMALNERVQNGSEKITVELMGFLRNWLKNHILIEDKRYAPVLIDHGVKASWKDKSWIGKIWSSKP